MRAMEAEGVTKDAACYLAVLRELAQISATDLTKDATHSSSWNSEQTECGAEAGASEDGGTVCDVCGANHMQWQYGVQLLREMSEEGIQIPLEDALEVQTLCEGALQCVMCDRKRPVSSIVHQSSPCREERAHSQDIAQIQQLMEITASTLKGRELQRQG